MTAFSSGVQIICLGALGALLVYTLALVRIGRLSARVTVSWILADLVAIAAILLWGRLPVIAYTSALGDRELLIVLAVLFFSYIAYLMLDSLQRISAQSAQIARLAQHVALLEEARTAPSERSQQDAPAVSPMPLVPDRATWERAHSAPTAPRRVLPVGQTVLATWLILCFGLYVAQAYDSLPGGLRHLLLAAYKE